MSPRPLASILLLLASGAPDAVSKILGQLRLLVAKKENLMRDGRWELLWVTDFPLFDWNADDSAYEASFAGDQGGDEDLLEGLEQDLDLSGFLPDKEVAEGDSWSLESATVRALLAPCGDVKLRPGDAGELGGAGQFSQNDLIGEIDGKFDATYAGTQGDGASLAVIKLDTKEPLPFLEFGDSDAMEVGDQVLGFAKPATGRHFGMEVPDEYIVEK